MTRVFVLCTGRCGSTTFARAAAHATNFTAKHESRTYKLGAQRLAYPDNHIEVDNRLAWWRGVGMTARVTPAANRWADLKPRLLSALVMIGIGAVEIWLGGWWPSSVAMPWNRRCATPERASPRLVRRRRPRPHWRRRSS